jgi:ABC-type antimicrobial peptide transport system permease subunit
MRASAWADIKTQLLLILCLTLLSAFNYISLSLARAFSRAKEVGIRKTIGATRGQVIGQFLMEAILISILALLFTVPCVGILKHYIPDMDDVAFSWDPIIILVLLIYAVITGFSRRGISVTAIVSVSALYRFCVK